MPEPPSFRSEAGNEVVAVDLSEEMLTIATNAGRAHITYIHGDACSLNWWDGTQFDGVISSMALMDIDDLQGALTTTAATVRRGGWFAPVDPVRGAEVCRELTSRARGM